MHWSLPFLNFVMIGFFFFFSCLVIILPCLIFPVTSRMDWFFLAVWRMSKFLLEIWFNGYKDISLFLPWKAFASPSVWQIAFLVFSCIWEPEKHPSRFLKFLLTNLLLLWWVWLYMWFNVSLLPFEIYFGVFSVWVIIWWEELPFWAFPFGVFSAPCIWIGTSFPNL